MTISLEPLAREHLPDVESLLRDPDVLRFTRVPEPPPAGFAESWLATQWAFKTLGAVRLELLIGVENEASKRVAERSGYRREGLLRSVYLKQGRRENTEIWSRLRDDPEP